MEITEWYISIKLAYPLTLRPDNRCRGHTLHLVSPRDLPKSMVRRNFFTERVVKIWNQLPEKVVSAPTLSTFKSRLDRFWSNERNLAPCYCVKDGQSEFCIPQPIV